MRNEEPEYLIYLSRETYLYLPGIIVYCIIQIYYYIVIGTLRTLRFDDQAFIQYNLV